MTVEAQDIDNSIKWKRVCFWINEQGSRVKFGVTCPLFVIDQNVLVILGETPDRLQALVMFVRSSRRSAGEARYSVLLHRHTAEPLS